MQICGRTGMHSTEIGEGHTASKKKLWAQRINSEHDTLLIVFKLNEIKFSIIFF
jgi:hypothetical protein